MFQLFRNVSKQNWNKLSKKWKYQASFLVFRNNEAMDYIGKKLKRTETGRKLTKSKSRNVSKQNWNKLWKKWKYQAPMFQLFRNKIETSSGKSENTRPISGVSKHWNNGLYREKTETDWNRKKIDEVQMFQLFRNVSKQNWNKLWKKCKIVLLHCNEAKATSS